MKIPVTFPRVAALAVCASLLTSAQAQTSTIGQAMINPFFNTGATDWTLNAPWRDDGFALVFDVSNTNGTGFFSAVGATKDLTTEANVLALEGYDPATTRLTGFNFPTSNPFTITFGTVPDGTYNLYFEVVVNTAAGNYVASNESTPFVNQFGGGVSLTPTFAWVTGGFLNGLGDIAAASGGGVALSSINSISYSAVMNIVSPTSGAPAFMILDNMSLEYQVSAIPEPSAFAGVAGLAALALFAGSRRRFRVTQQA